ncbi:hypothetical protein NIES2107_17950 [Nostoc carneum NIES-2107]|nr:hypothetical protein NIES2107_17950 [Nostoc carneum NIES-2107]
MNSLKIQNLSFCETVSGSQVQGGVSEAPNQELDLLDWLTKNIPGFEKQTSEQKEEYLLETFGDRNNENYGYRAISPDGRKVIGGATGQINNVNYAVSFARSSI